MGVTKTSWRQGRSGNPRGGFSGLALVCLSYAGESVEILSIIRGWDDLRGLRILRVPVLFPPIAGYSPGEIHTGRCALVVRILRRHSNLQTSSLGSCPYFGSKSLARFCCEFLNLQPLAESAFSKFPQPIEARLRQAAQRPNGILLEPFPQPYQRNPQANHYGKKQ
jgi:hypothetical protein